MLVKYKRYLLPITLGVLGLLLLVRVFSSATLILVPEDIDVVVLVSLLGVAIIAAIHTIVRISMQYLRWLSVQRVRQETLTEHSHFLRRLDHELKNPLTTLRAGLSTLSLTNLDGQQQQIVVTMETETLRLSRLITDLRKLAELETQPLNLQAINLEAFFLNIVQAEHDRFETSGRKLASHIDAAPATWVADEDLLALAVHNLLDNAFKYTQSGDVIRLKVMAQHELCIQVTDTGIGIPSNALPYIWNELYRVERTQKISGSGIGLALVKAIVERHNGAAIITSEPGQGTTVSICFPPASQS